PRTCSHIPRLVVTMELEQRSCLFVKVSAPRSQQQGKTNESWCVLRNNAGHRGCVARRSGLVGKQQRLADPREWPAPGPFIHAQQETTSLAMFERPAKAPQAAKKHGYRRDTNHQHKGSTRHDCPLRPTGGSPWPQTAQWTTSGIRIG